MKTVKNAVSLARAVMEKTDHVLLVGEGADDFARSIGFPQVENKTLVSKQAIIKLQTNNEFQGTLESNFSPK